MAKKLSNSDSPEIVMEDLITELQIASRANSAKLKKGDAVSGVELDPLKEDDPTDICLPLEDVTLQYVLAINAIRQGTIVEMIGEEGIGKTSFVFNLLGKGLRAHPYSAAIYLNSEGRNKLTSVSRLKACMSKDKEESEQLFKRVIAGNVGSLNDALNSMVNYGQLLRQSLDKRGIAKKDSPIFIAVDTLSKLMPKSEAILAGLGDKGVSKNIMEDTSNLEFAKTMQKWSRWVGTQLDEYGICLILVSHQNTKIDMSFAGKFLTQADMKENNKTKIGGNSVNQSATIQFTLTRSKALKHKTTTSEETIGQVIKLKVVKNSNSVPDRKIYYKLNTNPKGETETQWPDALDFTYGLPEMFIQEHLYGVKVEASTKDTFSSKPLQLEKVERDLLIEKLNTPEVLKDVMTQLNIRGYIAPKYKAESFPVDEDNILEENNAADTEIESEESFDDLDITKPSKTENKQEENIVINSEISPIKKRGRKPKVIVPEVDEEPDL